MRLQRSAHWAVIILGTVALFAALRYAADIVAPLTLALVLGVVLSPISTALERLGAGKIGSAIGVVLFSLCVMLGILLFLGPYLSRLWVQAPAIWLELRLSFLEFQQLIQGLSDASEEVAKAIGPENGQAEEEPAGPAVPSVTDAILAAPAFAAQLVIFLGSLFFFVLSREQIYQWLAHTLYGPDSVMAQRLEEADRLVSRYFLTIAVINIVFGACAGAALWLVGLPSPILWGVLAALMNFILYLGPALMAVGLLITGIVVFDGLQAALPPLVYVSLNFIEGQFVTPLMIGRHIRVNPLLVFLSLVFWLWLWGPIGGIIAIPVVIWCLALAGQMGDLRAFPKMRRPRNAGN